MAKIYDMMATPPFAIALLDPRNDGYGFHSASDCNVEVFQMFCSGRHDEGLTLRHDLAAGGVVKEESWRYPVTARTAAVSASKNEDCTEVNQVPVARHFPKLQL